MSLSSLSNFCSDLEGPKLMSLHLAASQLQKLYASSLWLTQSVSERKMPIPSNGHWPCVCSGVLNPCLRVSRQQASQELCTWPKAAYFTRKGLLVRLLSSSLTGRSGNRHIKRRMVCLGQRSGSSYWWSKVRSNSHSDSPSINIGVGNAVKSLSLPLKKCQAWLLVLESLNQDLFSAIFSELLHSATLAKFRLWTFDFQDGSSALSPITLAASFALRTQHAFQVNELECVTSPYYFRRQISSE